MHGNESRLLAELAALQHLGARPSPDALEIALRVLAPAGALLGADRAFLLRGFDGELVGSARASEGWVPRAAGKEGIGLLGESIPARVWAAALSVLGGAVRPGEHASTALGVTRVTRRRGQTGRPELSVLPPSSSAAAENLALGERRSATEEGKSEGNRLEGQPLLAASVDLLGHSLVLVFLRREGELDFDEPSKVLLASILAHFEAIDATRSRVVALWRDSITDELTHLYNYRHARRKLERMLRRLDLDTKPITVVMADVDNLREYNRHFGHLAGSRVLVEVAAVLKRAVRDGDWVGKYGGDEFLVVLPETDRRGGLVVARRLRDLIEEARPGKKAFGGMTCSFGVATAPEDGTTFVKIVSAADHALFAAKERGRNEVVAYEPSMAKRPPLTQESSPEEEAA